MFDVKGKTIIAVAPHLDDAILGAGATINHLIRDNTIYYIGLSLPPMVDKNIFMQEFHNSLSVLGILTEQTILKEYNPRDFFAVRTEILQLLYDLNRKLNPYLVLMPNSHDFHQAHEVVFAEGRRAFKYSTILGYELPWNNMDFSMDVFITLDKKNIEAKTRAINSFKTQKNRIFFSNDIIQDLAKVRGKQVARDYAECFELIRMII